MFTILLIAAGAIYVFFGDYLKKYAKTAIYAKNAKICVVKQDTVLDYYKKNKSGTWEHKAVNFRKGDKFNYLRIDKEKNTEYIVLSATGKIGDEVYIKNNDIECK